jgi:hypothetical protein
MLCVHVLLVPLNPHSHLCHSRGAIVAVLMGRQGVSFFDPNSEKCHWADRSKMEPLSGPCVPVFPTTRVLRIRTPNSESMVSYRHTLGERSHRAVLSYGIEVVQDLEVSGAAPGLMIWGMDEARMG